MLSDRAREVCFRIILNQRIYGASIQYIAGYEIEGDRRRQKKAIRLATEAGYITACDVSTQYRATTKAYDEVEAKAPNLLAHWSANQDAKTPFVPFNGLPNSERKYVAENPHLFKILLVRFGYREVEIVPCADLADFQVKYKEKEEAARKESRHNHDWQLAITTDELIAYGTTAKQDAALDYAYKNNLEWGLAALGLLEKDEAKGFADSDCIFGQRAEPDVWSDSEVDKRIASVEEAIARSQARLASLQKLKANIGTVGGWDGFREQYRELIRQELAKKE